jgi:FtsP/CotA-like multicopper oxidase with cupredoxin domain
MRTTPAASRRARAPALSLLLLLGTTMPSVVLAAGGKASCARTVAVDPAAARSPLASVGDKCGPFLALCASGLCCSQSGYCGADATSCGTTCQCSFSGRGSACRGRYPPALPSRLPVARGGDGAPCGAYVAMCPRGYCCTEQSVCARSDSSSYCLSAGCQAEASRNDGGACAAASALRPRRVFERTLALGWTEAAPDGYERAWISVNGKFPADNLVVDVGDRLIITVVNGLDVATSLHSHGFVQRRTGTSDGVATVTQRPIPPGESFVYNFVADAPGTFWMHAHQKAQEMDGLRLAVVVRDPAEALPGRAAPPLYYGRGVGRVASDQVVALADLYHALSAVLVREYLSPLSDGNEPVPQGAMINGVSQTPGCTPGGAGGDACTFARVDAGPSAVACPPSGAEPPGQASEFATLLRIVNMAGMAAFRFSIDGHMMRVVGADSTPVDAPRLARSLVVNAAQRYDVLVCREEGAGGGGAPATAPAWIRAEMYPGVFYEEPEHPLVLGVLFYGQDAGAVPAEPILPPPDRAPALDPFVRPLPPAVLNPQQLAPAGNLPPPPPATRVVRLALNFTPVAVADPTIYAVFNNVSFAFSPSSPSLQERYSGTPPGPPPKPNGRGSAVFGFNVLEVRTGEVVEIRIDNFDTGEHPIHLHGTDGFWVTRYGAPNDGPYAPGKGYVGTVARDTETVNLKSFLVLRYVPANKGTLMIMHCHISWHLSAGLATVFRTV